MTATFGDQAPLALRVKPMTEAERHLAYIKAQIDHPNPQLKPRLRLIFAPYLPLAQDNVDRERGEGPTEGRPE